MQVQIDEIVVNKTVERTSHQISLKGKPEWDLN